MVMGHLPSGTAAPHLVSPLSCTWDLTSPRLLAPTHSARTRSSRNSRGIPRVHAATRIRMCVVVWDACIMSSPTRGVRRPSSHVARLRLDHAGHKHAPSNCQLASRSLVARKALPPLLLREVDPDVVAAGVADGARLGHLARGAVAHPLGVRCVRLLGMGGSGQASKTSLQERALKAVSALKNEGARGSGEE